MTTPNPPQPPSGGWTRKWNAERGKWLWEATPQTSPSPPPPPQVATVAATNRHQSATQTSSTNIAVVRPAQSTVNDPKELRNKYLVLEDNTDWHWCGCDICRADGFTGKRYLCMICADFDLCNECRFKHSSTGHPMIRVTSPLDMSWQYCHYWSLIFYAVDDGCDIYSCALAIETCKKYEYINRERTGFGGTFESAFDEFLQAVDTFTNRQSYDCDECGLDTDIRMTCVICDGYNLCQACEVAGKHDHHPMIQVLAPSDFSWIPGWLLAKSTLGPDSCNQIRQQMQNEPDSAGNTRQQMQNEPASAGNTRQQTQNEPASAGSGNNNVRGRAGPLAVASRSNQWWTRFRPKAQILLQMLRTGIELANVIATVS